MSKEQIEAVDSKELVNVRVCPGTLAEGFTRYSPFCVRHILVLTSVCRNLFSIRQRFKF